MTSARLQIIEAVFHQALDCEPGQLHAFLDKRCAGDEDLRSNVQALLTSHREAESFIQTSIGAVAADIVENEQTDWLIGKTIGHYKISKRIGVGGMGVVYLARDERLGRKVALKFLPARLTADKMQLSRFKSEARAASALNHPNILTVYEIGAEGDRHFIATEFIEGMTLRASLARGRMDAGDTLEIAVQVASALAAAHKAGVVHRDIKPENIMLRPDGYVKVLDFGIAKLTEQKSGSDDREMGTTTALQTHTGLVLGTALYMSPEQTRGQSVDARSDIWSLGAVVYEMASGVPPFSGETPSDCIASILKTEAPPLASLTPSVPVELQSIVQKALRKNANERYQTIAEMLADLRSLKGKQEREASAPKIKAAWLWTAAASMIAVVSLATLFFVRYHWGPYAPSRANASPARTDRAPAIADFISSPPTSIPEKSVAVLPFDNLSDDKQNAYFAIGVQDEITSDLARIADLKVISRTSANLYKSGNPRNSREIGQQLGVAHLVEGNVQRIGNRIRVNAQLIKANSDAHVWAQTYDRDVSDLFAIQSEIAQAIAGQLYAKISPAEKRAIERPPTADLTAFDLDSRAEHLLLASYSSNGRANLLQAVDLLNQAVARDPAFFQAYCQLAFAHDHIYFLGFERTPARLALAEGAIQAAFRLRPDAGEAHLARAEHLYRAYLDYPRALTELDIAGQTLPNEPRVFELKGYIERRQGKHQEALGSLERAMDLDPRNFFILQQITLSYELLRRYADEKSVLDRMLVIEPNDAETKVTRAFVELDWKADTKPLHQVIDSIRSDNPAAVPDIADSWFLCALAERDPAAAANALRAGGENGFGIDAVRLTSSFGEGLIARMIKDEDKARPAFNAARVEQQKVVESQPDYGPALCVLGLIDAYLGRKEEALREGRRAVELLPVQTDAINGPHMIEFLAIMAAWVGDKDLACEQLAAAVAYPGRLSYGQLKLLPFWDPLRGDPRFEQIVASLAPKAISPPLPIPEKSVAVLPFDNLSDDKQNAYFAIGVQDEILSNLARIADLKVISRTSANLYKSGNPRNSREIGQQLGVAHLLEGNVQRIGNRLRVNAQLIKADTDTHVWAQTYNRDVADLFAIQSEIAQAIAAQLAAQISPAEKRAIERPPTTDLTAFDLYTRAKSLSSPAFFSNAGKKDLLEAAGLLNQAVSRDPAFFQAYCQLAWVHDVLYFLGYDRTPARLALGEAAIQAAFRLRPDAGEAHLARAENLYRGYLDYDGALTELEVAHRTLPNDPRIFELMGLIQRRSGRWEESTRNLKRAVDLDPRNLFTLSAIADSYRDLRNYSKAEAAYDRLLAIEPNDIKIKVRRANVELDWKADTRPLHQLMDSIRAANPADIASVADTWLICALAERDPTAANDALMASGENTPLNNDVLRFSRSFVEGIIARMTKDEAKAQSAFSAARVEQEKIVRAQPDYGPPLVVLGLIEAALGQKEEALRDGRRAVELLPVEKDSIKGALMIEYLAMIAAWVGEKGMACQQLGIAVGYPGPLSYGELKLLPFWDPLRGEPCLEQIVASLAPKEN